jgi:hypothetical protein
LKPFSCDHKGCNRRFNRQDSLKRHRKVHKQDEQSSVDLSSDAAIQEASGNVSLFPGPPTMDLSGAGPQESFFPTPATVNADLGVSSDPQDQYMWPETEDLLALLTAEPAEWRFDAQLPFLDMSLFSADDSRAGSEDRQPNSTSSRARQAMQHMSNLLRDISLNVSREVEATGVTGEFLDTCLSCFWMRFISVFPVMHQPTFCLKDCTPPLLLNMIALGSLFVASEGAVALGEALWRLAHTGVATSWQSMLQQTDEKGRGLGMQLVMTALLGQSYALLSGNRALRLTSHVFHGLGFYWSRQAGLGSRHAMDGIQPNITPDALQAKWKSWASQEVRNRALLGHYILDGLISQSSGLPNSARHTLNNMPLPSSDEAFEAPTAEAWLTAIQMGQEEPPLTVRSIFVSLFEFEKPFEAPMLSHMTVPAVVEALQSLIAESHEADGPAVGVPDIDSISRALCRLYQAQIEHSQRPHNDRLDLAIRWHVLGISLCVEPSRLVLAMGTKYGVQQELYGGQRPSGDRTFDVDAWQKSHWARRAVFHAFAVLDLVQQLPLNKVQALHLPLALQMAALVLVSTSVGQPARVYIPLQICWRTVCTLQEAPLSPLQSTQGESGLTYAFIKNGALPSGSCGSHRNILRDITTLQSMLESSISTWGISKEISQFLRRLMNARKQAE